MSGNEKYTLANAMQGGHEMSVEKENKFSFITETESKLMKQEANVTMLEMRQILFVQYYFSCVLKMTISACNT